MNIFTTLSQYQYSSGNTRVDEATVLVFLTTFFLLYLITFVAIYIVSAIFLAKIFKKAGLAGWPAWVPFYNNWKLLEIGGQPGFWAALSWISPINIVTAVFTYIAMYHVGLKLGKSGAFVVLGIFLPVVWIIWLAVDKSTWNEEASPAANRATGPLPAQPIDAPKADA